jgi:Mu transposase, C-terminal
MYKSFFTRRERTKREALWIEQTKLLSITDGLSLAYLEYKARAVFKSSVSPNRRQQSILPDTGEPWRWAKVGGAFYYDWDYIPSPTKNKCRFSTKDDLLDFLENEQSQAVFYETSSAIKFLMQDMRLGFYEFYQGYDRERREALVGAASLVAASVQWLRSSNYNIGKSKFWVDLGALVETEGLRYLPKNWRRLKDKVMEVYEGKAVYQVVVLPREGLKNAGMKYAEDKPQIIGWLLKMRVAELNYTDALIIRELRRLCYLTGKQVPSEGWFKGELAKPETKNLTIMRTGEKSRRLMNNRGYVPIETAVFAGDCWQMDATRFNTISHKGENGKECFMMIIVVRDVMSGDILGEHYDLSENRYGYMAALKMAVQATGYVPYELVTDRFPGYNTEEWEGVKSRLNAFGTKVTETSLATGKARTERWFGTLQTVFMAKSKYYYGEGIMSKRVYAHRSIGYLQKMKKTANAEGWDFDKSLKECEDIVESYRMTPYCEYSKKYSIIQETPRQLHDRSAKPHTVALEAWEVLTLFDTGKLLSLRGNMVKMTIAKADYVYFVDNEVALVHKQVMVYYDIEDLDSVYVWDKEGRNMLCEAKRQQNVQIYGPNADFEALGKVKAKVKDFEQLRKERLAAKVAEDVSDFDVLVAVNLSKVEQENIESRFVTSRMQEKKEEIIRHDEMELEEVEIDVAQLTRQRY